MSVVDTEWRHWDCGFPGSVKEHVCCDYAAINRLLGAQDHGRHCLRATSKITSTD